MNTKNYLKKVCLPAKRKNSINPLPSPSPSAGIQQLSAGDKNDHGHKYLTLPYTYKVYQKKYPLFLNLTI